jgi:methylenetetrahydrofolate reductase (NADPH)
MPIKIGIGTTKSKELIKAGVPVLHFYTMGSADPVKKVATKIF